MGKKQRHIGRWISLTLLALILGVILFSFASGGYLSQLASAKGSSSLGRQFAIDGGITVDWDWTTPYVHLEKVRLSNMPQSQDPNMVSINEVNFHIKIWKLLEGQLNLPDISLDQPTIVLEKYDPNTANWDFPALSSGNAITKGALPNKRGNFPILGNISIHKGRIVYRDLTKKLSLSLGIDTAQGGGGEKGDFIFTGTGSLQGKPFVINAQGGSLGMLRNSNVVYPLNLHIQMGDTIGDIAGTFADPVQLEGIDTKLDLKGSNLADLFYLTAIPLPPSPPYKLSGHLMKKGQIWTFENFVGKVGGSDLSGSLTYDLSDNRGYMKADLISKLLDMKDLAGFVGATAAPKPGEKTSAQQEAQVAKEKASPKLLPDVPLDLTRLRTSDLDVSFKANQVLAPGLPMNDMDVGFHLKDGILRLDPFSFGIAAGNLSGSLILNGQNDIPEVSADLTLTRLSLKKFFTDPTFASLTAGYFGGRFKLRGTGKSLAEVLASSNGEVTMVMSGGKISQLIVDAAGLDIGRAAPILLGDDKSTDIRCAVSDFKVDDGILNSRIFVFDTTISNIAGEAHINLKNETIKARIEAEPKNPSVTVHAPITIDGQLKHPVIGLDLQETAERGGAAAVLSIFLIPIAAIVPFIELGVGKDSDCKSLIDQAKAHSSSSPPSLTN